MAAAIRSISVGTNDGSSATVAVTTPSDGTAAQVGDVAVVAHMNNFYAITNMVTPTATGSPTLTAVPDGIADGGTNLAHIKSYTYTVNTAGAQTVTTTETGSHDEEKAIAVVIMSGVDTADPVDDSHDATGNGVTQAAAAVAPDSANTMMLLFNCSGGGASSASYTVPLSMTEDTEIHNGGQSGVIAHEALSASGDTGTRTVTALGSIPWASVTLAMRAASGATDLTVANAAQAQSADNVILTQEHSLVVAASTQAQNADNVTLTQVHNLVVQDAVQGQTAENVTLTQVHQLSVDNAAQTQSVDNVILTQVHSLAVADANQAQSAENVVLTVGGITLLVQDAVQAQQVDNITLTQVHDLIVNSATQNQTADSIIFGDAANGAVTARSEIPGEITQQAYALAGSIE